jgi:Na+/proline symporter
MHWLDWLIVAAYLTYISYDGLRLTKKSTEVEGYFLAHRSLPWWAVGLSVMATQLSAITLVGTTGQAYADGMRFIQFYFGLPFAMVILCMTVVPFFYRAKVFTAYEYLERRFDAKTRALTSFFFLVSRGLSCGVIIAAPSVILSIVFGWNELTTILVMGLTTTVYTMFGGVQAVTWTDVKQMVIIFIGLFALLFVIVGKFPDTVSLGDAMTIAGGDRKAEDRGSRCQFERNIYSLVRPHRRNVSGDGIFRLRPESGAEISDGQIGNRGTHVFADERLHQDTHAGPHSIHRSHDLRLLPVPETSHDFQVR